MNCEEFMSMLDRFADLTEKESAQLEKHASICDSCRSELEFMKSIISTAQSLPPIEPPSDFLETVNNRLDKELAAEPKIVYFMRHAKPYINRYGTIAACLAIGIAIGANGNMLVSRMNNNGDGVISRTTTLTDNTTTLATDNGLEQPITTPAPEKSKTPEIIGESTVHSNVNKASAVVQRPLNVNTTQETEVKAVQTAKPVTPSATMPAPVVTEAPAVTAVPEKATEVKESENVGIMTASLTPDVQDAPIGYRSVRMIEEPEVTPEVYAAAEVDVAAEYSMATLAPQSETAYVAPLSSTIMVKSSDEARAREIIMEFVEATYGNYYMITGDKLYNLTVRLESEGIWYQANITDSGVKVSFKLVTM